MQKVLDGQQFFTIPNNVTANLLSQSISITNYQHVVYIWIFKIKISYSYGHKNKDTLVMG